MQGDPSFGACSGRGHCYLRTLCVNFAGMAVTLTSGFIELQSSSFFTLNNFLLEVRTTTPNAVLVNFGGVAALELQEGNVVYRRNRGTLGPGQLHSAITLTAYGFIDDGLWHHIHFFTEPSFTKVLVGVVSTVGVV